MFEEQTSPQSAAASNGNRYSGEHSRPQLGLTPLGHGQLIRDWLQPRRLKSSTSFFLAMHVRRRDSKTDDVGKAYIEK